MLLLCGAASQHHRALVAVNQNLCFWRCINHPFAVHFLPSNAWSVVFSTFLCIPQAVLARQVQRSRSARRLPVADCARTVGSSDEVMRVQSSWSHHCCFRCFDCYAWDCPTISTGWHHCSLHSHMRSVVRLIRSFRVVRLLSRFKALREIMSALFQSIIPVTNAFTILILIISVCVSQCFLLASVSFPVGV
jgi:hypothetical protein